ncbi:unnamed protein product [Brassica napus]|nr:unnamed protein product [Brassica napus]
MGRKLISRVLPHASDAPVQKPLDDPKSSTRPLSLRSVLSDGLAQVP